MIYIDFDGVILDTEPLLFEEWRKNPNRHLLPEGSKIEYVKNSDWKYIIYNSKVINDSLYCLKNMNPNESFILTKVHSLDEGTYKIKWLRENNVKQDIVLTPYKVSKINMVNPKDNILVDDGLKNLDEWVNNGGIPVLFDLKNNNHDSWGIENVNNYEKVLSLHKFMK